MDWAQSQDYNRVTIGSASPESVGGHLPGAIIGASLASATWPAANRAIYIPFLVYRPFVAAQIALVNGATASGNLDAGIFDERGNLIVSKGSTAQAGANAVQALDITDTVLVSGQYYMALSMDGTTGTTYRWNPAVAMCSAMGVLSQSLGSVTLPSPATFAAAQDAYLPVMYITSRTVI